ncbi:MAG: aminopeptidase P N-terminal domain-containing protein [Anaeromyxobacter sp.]|nr:aminopeptidase P N-terminal domain-containing protein [Anaeromyxobacter sp.]MBL0276256.1 aminopeptidase P N-terminal domain-containing protein [Anaeromyxobacter sp.]
MDHDASLYAARRARVFEAMERQGGGVMLLPAADEALRNGDAEYPFRQDSDFYWLTGFDEPQGCAVLSARPGERRFLLFVRPKDRAKEIWTGRRLGVEGATAVLGADAAFTVADQEAQLPGLLDAARTLWFKLGAADAWDARVVRLLVELRAGARTGRRAPGAVVEPGRILHELRLVKDATELGLLRKAADLTAEAHLSAMRDGWAGRREHQVQAEIEYAFRRRGGSGPGYGTIVASGANSTILHHRAGDAVLRDGDVCLVDAGGEYQLYTADVTRTFPVSGQFTEAQARLYTLCLEVQKRAIAAVRPGATVEQLHDLTVRGLTEGLCAMGLLSGTPEERIADQGFRRYYMHRTSHWLGMDVHDVGDYQVDGASRPLVPGMVLTIEPGLYVAEDDETAPPGLRGVGIRIEDDILVTADGHQNLTAGVPKEIAELEAACVR